jgi:hypothetical protein
VTPCGLVNRYQHFRRTCCCLSLHSTGMAHKATQVPVYWTTGMAHKATQVPVHWTTGMAHKATQVPVHWPTGCPTCEDHNLHIPTKELGHAIVQAVNNQPLTMQPWVESQANPCGIDMWWADWHWDRYFAFFLSVSFHHCSLYLSNHMCYKVLATYSVSNSEINTR